MKKAGDKTKSFLVHGIFIALVILAIIIVVGKEASITGDAVLDAKTAKQGLESALASSSAFSGVLQSSICVIVNDPSDPVVLSAKKSTAGWTVKESSGYCGGFNTEDVIVQFSSYSDFSSIVDNPSPKNIAQAAIKRDFEVLQSKYVELGGNVICDATFKVKYCNSLNAMANSEELIDGDLVCCLDSLSKEQKALLEQHLQQGNFKDEIGLVQESARGGSASILSSSMTLIGGGGLAAILLIIVVMMVLKGKSKPKPLKNSGNVPAGQPGQNPMSGQSTPGSMGVLGAATMGGTMQPTEDPQIVELRGYIAQTLMQGYAPEDLKSHLLEIGWDTGTADKVILEEYQRLAAQTQNN